MSHSRELVPTYRAFALAAAEFSSTNHLGYYKVIIDGPEQPFTIQFEDRECTIPFVKKTYTEHREVYEIGSIDAHTYEEIVYDQEATVFAYLQSLYDHYNFDDSSLDFSDMVILSE